MKLTAKYALLLFLLSIIASHAAWSWYPALKGAMPLPPVNVIDEHDQTIGLREAFRASSKPALLVPVFTRCQMSCPVLVHTLEKAVANSGLKQDAFRIVLLSFDANDTSADLRSFRDREHVPATWTLVRAKDSNTIREFFDQYSFSIMDSDGGFSHPSEVFVLDGSLQWAGSLLGPDLTPTDLQKASEIASGTGTFGSNPETLLILGAIGLLGSLLVAFYIVLRPSRRITENEA